MKLSEQLLRVAARDHEADALVGDAPDARRRFSPSRCTQSS
jgi:hypothetical protein